MNKFEEAAKQKTEEKKAERKRLRDEAQKFVDDFRKEHGTKGYIAIRIRDGFIGKDIGGNNLQLERAKPRGTIVAIKDPNKDGEIRFGWTYKSNKDEDIPIVGLAKALQAALSDEPEAELLRKKDEGLLEFFIVRAKCFFYPEIYSYSRGTQKLEYPNWEKVHEGRRRALKYIGREDLIQKS